MKTEFERLIEAGIASESAGMADVFYETADAVLEDAMEYIQAVVEDRVLSLRRTTMDAYNYQLSTVEVTSCRETFINLLVMRVDSLNRYCDQLGIEQVYQGGEDKAEYGEFAITLVQQAFSGQAA